MHSSAGDNADPNLVPLLDLVLQLIMFFLMVVSFVAEQVNQDIILPAAQSARPMDKRILQPLFINLDAQGRVLAPGQPRPLTTIPEISYYLRQCHDDALRLAQQQGDTQVHTVVVVRADRKADYAYVYHVLRLCKQAGFRHLQLRAQISEPEA